MSSNGTAVTPASEGTSIGNLWPIGVIIVIAASVGSNGGINLQKVSITREVQKPMSEQRPFPLQPLWLLGFVAVVAGAIGDFAGLAFAPQSLLIPLGGTSLIANIWFARWCVAAPRRAAASPTQARFCKPRRTAQPAPAHAPFSPPAIISLRRVSFSTPPPPPPSRPGASARWRRGASTSPPSSCWWA